ncbi:phosphotransferase [Leucobacter rhizosphaerae]|uniref:Phosphotransferase n=1 Tax=Leucobacter rhizosphaerae TaxID=2932245 RepID=A0ABY4FWF6_9MICO|nr:phosphotransferase [Leucobacter rhizosphaerae]UOQ60630.1 phosphotransferase [Leucobacter rhizosphaerae]
MASIPFTLAALATSAVPGLVVLGARGHEEDESFASAIVTDGTDELLVRVPRSQAAEVQQSAELLGLAALTEGSRAALPFAIPESLGMTRAGDSRAVVTTYVDGGRFDAEDLQADSLLIQPIAQAIAAIHGLPQSVAHQGGLPIRSAQDLRLQATRLIDRAESTRLVPQTILSRWTRVLEAGDLWDFEPTMIHGSLEAEHFRVTDDEVTGIVGWSECSVGDPASDLAWLLGAGPDVLNGVLARYATLRDRSSLAAVRTRTALYHELEIARWLLHGVESHDDEITDDAVRMLDRLVDRVGSVGTGLSAGLGAATPAPLSETEVESLLAETPEVHDLLSDTAAFEALDEDRMFGVDTDFIEPLRDGTGEESAAELAADPDDTAGHASGDSAGHASDDRVDERSEARDGERGPHDHDDQLTEPISDDELPERDR